MKQVIISKEKLLQKIKENKNNHRAIFEDALAGWKERVTEELNQALNDAMAGKKFRTYFDLPQPIDHTPEYVTIIEQIEWTEEKQIELDFIQFNQFVLDDWGWKEDFLMNASTYTSPSSSSSSLLNSELKKFR